MIKRVEFVLHGYDVPGLENRIVKWYSSYMVSIFVIAMHSSATKRTCV